MNPVIATLDIETSPYEAYVWELWDQNVGIEQIKAERSILSFGYKKLGKTTEYYDVTGQKNLRDDSKLLEILWEKLDGTDIVVAQNGKKFDIKIINARLAIHGFPPYSPIRIIDTMQIAKKHFRFSSNKLAWLSKYLTDSAKSEHKEFPGMELWIECLKGNSKAWNSMRKYNVRDIVATEKLYLKLRPWIDNHPNVGVYSGESHTCPACGSSKVQSRGFAITQSSKYVRYHCQMCGKWSRGKQMLTPLEERKDRLG